VEGEAAGSGPPRDTATEPPVERELEMIGRRRTFRLAGVHIAGRRRRPSGERAPLPRELQLAGRLWLTAGLGAAVVWILLFVLPTTTDFWNTQDTKVLNWLVDQRTTSLTSLAETGHALGSDLFLRVLRVGTVVALAMVRRWRHFFAALIAILTVEAVTGILREMIGRPRPFVPIIGAWKGPAHPSAQVADLAVTLAVMGFALIPRGRWRTWFFWLSGIAILVLGMSRMYLGVDNPSDVSVAAIFGLAIAVIVFRLFAPESEFPVTWKRGVKAHLEVTGARGAAIRKAVADQLGLQVLEIKPFGLEGSGGSTPLRLLVEGNPNQYVFAKLYSQTHLRSDRWYKLGRAILYGSLEDEVRFTSVRRLVEYEDYIQRLMRDSGIPSAEPMGIVEITEEREYLMVSQFLEGSIELTEAEVDQTTIDDALGVIRKLWDAGLAHRDIKPANVMIRDDKVVLIDVAFGTVRPSPWRQAVDLANMMVILGLRAGAEKVYQRALLQFAPSDIGEAFAATRSVTLPSQSRSSLAILRKDQGIDLVEEFRSLAPATEPISIQRWSPRRIALAAGAVLGTLALLTFVFSQVTGQGFL
jgi:membrane-associated phospholipid phosphatase/tRNA A-37 threonylcarbamoyl transferase component Bud32